MTTFNKDYPISMATLEGSGKSRIISNFNKVVPVIEEAYQNSEIISTQFEDVKYALNQFVEAAYEEFISKRFLWSGEYSKQTEEMQFINSIHEVRSISAYSKKLDKMSAESKGTEMYREAKKLVVELMPIFDTLTFLKEHMVKASVKKKALKEEKEAEEGEYIKKYVNHKDTQKVIVLLKETISNIEEKIYKGYLEELHRVVDNYKEKLASGESDYNEIYKKNGIARMIIQGVVERVGSNYTYNSKKEFALVKNYKELLDKSAKEYASDIGSKFVYKNTSKLSYILFTKNNLDTVEIKNVSLGKGYIECDLICKFKDGAEFLANTSIVLSYSKYDKPFYRYPTIFRNVKLADGTSLSEPSEERMDEVFAVADDSSQVPVKKNKMR